MKKIVVSVFLFFLLLINVNQIQAAEKLIFDSTNNYLGGCQLTDKSEWELNEDLNVSKFQIWYQWNANETSLPVKVFLDGKEFAEFDAVRSACDPYQKQWCNADYAINKLFPKGKYTTQIPDSRQCLKPGGTGTIRLYDEDAIVTQQPTAAVTKQTETKENTQVKPTTIISSKQPTTCPCDQTQVITTAAITAFVSSILTALILKKIKFV